MRTLHLSHLLSFLLINACMPIVKVASFTAPLEIYAYKFFDSSTGESINLKGIDYYPRPNTGPLNTNNVDFFTEEYRSVWEPDIAYFQTLGINAVRIYAVDPSQDHSGFMCALAQANIYVMVGLLASCQNCNISPDPAPNCYPASLKTRGQMVIAAFINFDNVLGFDAGNEVDLETNGQPWINAPCQKKFIRDMRAYIANCPTRKVPVGVVLADVQRMEKSDYYNCYTTASKDPYELAEWIGLNAYQSCNGNVTSLADAPGYQGLIADYSNFSIPVILTEYGCLNPSFPTIDGYQAQRNFYQAAWMFESGMKDAIAGGFAFEYSVEVQNADWAQYPFKTYSPGNFGIGYYSPSDCDIVNISCTYQPKPEFYNLQKEYAATQTTGEYMRSTFTPLPDRLLRSPCPANFAGIDNFTWPSDSQADQWCPWSNVIACPGQPSSNSSNTTVPAPLATPSPVPSSSNATPTSFTTSPAHTLTPSVVNGSMSPTAKSQVHTPTNRKTVSPTKTTINKPTSSMPVNGSKPSTPNDAGPSIQPSTNAFVPTASPTTVLISGSSQSTRAPIKTSSAMNSRGGGGGSTSLIPPLMKATGLGSFVILVSSIMLNF